MKLADLVAFYLGKPTASCKEAAATSLGTHSQELPLKVTEWPSEWQEAFEERAAIMEFEGGLRRDEADLAAEKSMRDAFLLYRYG